ncbi:TPA: hypothetical protein EYN98_17425 [Candidatus Poribacteria bacterium]|nr:hypothetical protein [Candidatus Poribacteria bacterium]HIB87955.1 hypothetical protein [Candidatus Poribacteria bacterium]HIO39305.1 hypothetical protein [Rhodospirillales bacterium]HIO80080.1 hypothetical protein [Candidatus Poribacteria bacterium]
MTNRTGSRWQEPRWPLIDLSISVYTLLGGDGIRGYVISEAVLLRWKIIRRIVCTAVAIDPMRWH